ncbi:MAG: hypothetical protein GWN79_18395, partial [Actinobacteria bacterium]|nr:hypothetical protein [Actinomycetota bacterium]NIS34079.1 hypothetical protein [Actinomycetota bacterium]NIT97231.1 hypothetical protein [Actinomycetota bacterium]NIU20923.1 hypothetical protein [Actinomycetota bacterium]NIU68876.1 hypothetical protein [Actinomycetota bacterium]
MNDDGALPGDDDALERALEDTDQEQTPAWKSRPLAARVLRVAIVAVPLVLVVFGAWQVNRALGPAANLTEAIARWAALSVLSTLVLVGIDRGARRVLPLATLLHLSIVFPDEAPSRFRVALKRGSTRQLARDVAEFNLDDTTPQEAAEYLLSVVADLSAHDRRTRGHTERVRAYADMVAVEMGLTDAEREKLHWAGL